MLIISILSVASSLYALSLDVRDILETVAEYMKKFLYPRPLPQPHSQLPTWAVLDGGLLTNWILVMVCNGNIFNRPLSDLF